MPDKGNRPRLVLQVYIPCASEGIGNARWQKSKERKEGIVAIHCLPFSSLSLLSSLFSFLPLLIFSLPFHIVPWLCKKMTRSTGSSKFLSITQCRRKRFLVYIPFAEDRSLHTETYYESRCNDRR